MTAPEGRYRRPSSTRRFLTAAEKGCSRVLGTAYALGERVHDGPADRRELIHQRVELAVADDEQLDDSLGTHRRGARNALDEGDLAEELTRAERSDRRPPIEDHDPAIEHDEELVAYPSQLLEDGVTAVKDIVD